MSISPKAKTKHTQFSYFIVVFYSILILFISIFSYQTAFTSNSLHLRRHYLNIARGYNHHHQLLSSQPSIHPSRHTNSLLTDSQSVTKPTTNTTLFSYKEMRWDKINSIARTTISLGSWVVIVAILLSALCHSHCHLAV